MLLATVACEKIIDQLYPRTPGSDVVFGQSSQRGVDTKASYSGTVDANKFERIDWVTGDAIRIFCNEAGLPACKYADYTVTAEITSSGKSSSAKLTHNPEDQGLTWGTTNPHKFVALCPAPGHGVSGTSVKIDSATCVLPATQTFSGTTPVLSDGNYTAVPDSQYIYLVGYGSANPGEEGDPVNMYFDPAITTFEFTLQNDYASHGNMTVRKAGIRTASGNLVGSYTVNVTGINGTDGTLSSDDVNTNGLTGNEITMDFSTSLTIAYGKTLTFTLFAQPGNDITKLTFWFIDDDGYTRSFEFKYADSSKSSDGYVHFTAFHKARIHGLLAPESAGWTINMTPVVADWSESSEETEMESGNTLTFTTPAVSTWTEEDKGHLSYTD